MSNNPLEAVTQAVNSLVTALKLPDESAKANEVLGEMSFPQFSRLLPYRDYNQESGLFMNDTTMGFMLEAIPINGANESIVEALDHMLRTKLPRGVPFCIHLMSSQLVGDRIEYGLREFSWSGEQAERFNAITHDARHDIDAKASKDFKEASDYFTSRKVSESGSHTDNNADSRVDQLSAALNSAKQSYDQYTTNMTRSHEYAEMASRTESMSGQMSEDLSQQFALYVMKHAPQDAEAILTNTSSPEIAERRRAMAWSFVQEQVQPGVDNAWRESRGDIGKGMESVPSGGGSQDIIADHQGHQAIIDQRTQDSNIRNDVKHQVDNMVTEYKGNIGDTQNSIHGEENIVDRQYSELKNNHKQEEIQQNNRYNEENKRQKLMPTPSEDALKQMVDDKKERLKGPL